MSIHVGSILPVGTVIHSMLTTAQFAAEYGDNWVLADGRTVYGSKYEAITGISLVPDMRGVFLRGKGATYNPDGDLALGTYSADKTGPHYHKAITTTGGGGSTVSVSYLSATDRTTFGPDITYSNYKSTDLGSGGNETSPKSVTVNIFIRIN